MIDAELDALAAALGAVEGVAAAHVWPGEWSELDAPRAVGLVTPAALVSVVQWDVVQAGQSPFMPGALADPGGSPPLGAGADAAAREAARLAAGPAPALSVALRLAVALVDARPPAGRAPVERLASRTRRLWTVAQAAAPVLVERGVLRVHAESLHHDRLRKIGLGAVGLFGTRLVEIPPARIDPRAGRPAIGAVVNGAPPRRIA